MENQKPKTEGSEVEEEETVRLKKAEQEERRLLERLAQRKTFEGHGIEKKG